MKRIAGRLILLPCLAAVFSLCISFGAQAKTDNQIKDGIYAGDIALGGMTVSEAEEAISSYVEAIGESKIVLVVGEDIEVSTTAEELGIRWVNRDLCDEAVKLGTQGNIVQRYKAIEDLKHENKVYPIELSFDTAAIDTILSEQCSGYDRPAIDMQLVKEGDSFYTVPGQTGYTLDVERSIDAVYEYLTGAWNGDDCRIELVVEVVEPRGSEEELAMVRDVLGTFTTSFTSSTYGRSANVENGCARINGTLLYPGDEFSTCDAIAPFTEENGYYMAGSYINGQVVDAVGGGVCQLSTTLYNAVLLAELEVLQRNNHSMVVSYVEPAADAAIAQSSGKDFRFMNSSDYPIYIECYVVNKHLTFTIYGVETRPEGRTLEFVSEVLETTYPDSEMIYVNAELPLGYIDVTGAHIGYKARLWKIVKEDGVEVSREIANESTYRMAPRSAVVGVATTDPNAYNEIMTAVATGSIDYVKGVIALLSSGQYAAPAE